MTTTLRPLGPEDAGPQGARSRDFAVCANGRPVGRLSLTTDARLGPGTGRIAALDIEPAGQRHGRGAVAALAAEEVLRDWGCRRVRARVPAGAAHALRLAAALGYGERDRGMAKPLAGPPPAPPPGSADRPMDPAGYARWEARARADRVRHWEDEGVPHEHAVALTDADLAALLPAGHRTEGHVLRVLTHRDTEVGWVWVRVGPSPGGPDRVPWVYLVETAEEHRGRGHGRTLMRIAERECLAAGHTELGLAVRCDNAPATRLYASLGYRPVWHEMAKPLL